jgi:hypothetical protein
MLMTCGENQFFNLGHSLRSNLESIIQLTYSGITNFFFNLIGNILLKHTSNKLFKYMNNPLLP